MYRYERDSRAKLLGKLSYYASSPCSMHCIFSYILYAVLIKCVAYGVFSRPLGGFDVCCIVPRICIHSGRHVLIGSGMAWGYSVGLVVGY